MPGDHEDGLTVQLAKWLASVDKSSLPSKVLHHSRRLLLDHLAAVVVGSSTDVSAAVLAVARETYRGDNATVVCGGRLSAGGAAFVNGSAAHGFELDDGYTPGSVHPGAVVIPAVLAAAESYGIDFGDMLAGIAAGFEVTCRIAEAGHPSTWRNGFHNTPITGVFGSASAVSVLLGLDEEVITHSLGIAGSHSGGLFAFLGEGAEVKRVHAGKAARDGLISVELARRGVTGPTDVLEDEKGYFSAFARGDWNEAAVSGGLGERWAMLNTYIKPYPCCRHLHGPIDAVLKISNEEGIGIDQVESVLVETYEVASHHSHKKVDNILDAQMSIPYVVTMALRDHAMGFEQFASSARSDPEVRSWLDRVQVVADQKLTDNYPRTRPALVKIRCKNGQELSTLVEQPWGEPSNPMSDDAVAEKARDLCEPFIGSERTDILVSSVMEGNDLKSLVDVLGEPSLFANTR